MTPVGFVLATVAPLLSELGFRKRAGMIFTYDLSPEMLGWVGLNRATDAHDPGAVEINPVIGVRHQPLERLVAELKGMKFHAYNPPTVCIPLGYLLSEGKYTAWFFRDGEVTEAGRDLVTNVASHGIPFMRSVVDLPNLRQRIEGRTGFDHQLEYRLPVAWLLSGEPERALATLDDIARVHGTRSDRAAMEFLKFADALRSRLGHSAHDGGRQQHPPRTPWTR